MAGGLTRGHKAQVTWIAGRIVDDTTVGKFQQHWAVICTAGRLRQDDARQGCPTGYVLSSEHKLRGRLAGVLTASDILDTFQLKSRRKGKLQLLPGGPSAHGQTIRRDQLMGVRPQFEGELMVFNRRGLSKRLSRCKRRKETGDKQTEAEEAMQPIHPSPAPQGGA